MNMTQNKPIKNLLKLFFVLFSKWDFLSFGSKDSNDVPQEKHFPEDFSSMFNFDLQFGQVSMLIPPFLMKLIIPNITMNFNV